MDKLKEIIRELIQQELKEATVTGAIDGGEGPPKTPKAFGNKKKKKKEISTNSTGYNVVNEGTFAVTIDLGRDLGGDGVVIVDAGSKGAAITMVAKNLRQGRNAVKSAVKVSAALGKKVDAVDEIIQEGYRKAKDEAGVRIAQAIHNNVDGIYELVIKDGKDPKEVMGAFEGPLKNSIKAGIKHKYKPHPKADGAAAQIKTFQSELKKFQKIADAVASKPSKAAIKRMKEAYRTIWNHKFGAEIALGGKLFDTIIETMNEGKYVVYVDKDGKGIRGRKIVKSGLSQMGAKRLYNKLVKTDDYQEVGYDDHKSWNQNNIEKLNEGKYHDYRNDESLSPKQKIGRSMREVRDGLNNLEKLVKMNVRLKNELNVNSGSYWKNTHKALHKISERLVKLANKVGQLQ